MNIKQKLHNLSLTITFALLSLFLPSLAVSEKLGVILPLSGPIARMGNSVKNVITLFQKLEPELSKKFEFVFEDGKYDGKETVTALRKLHSADKIKTVLIWGNTPSEVAAPVAHSLALDLFLVSHDQYSTKYPRVVELGPLFDSALEIVAKEVASIGSDKFGAIAINIGNVVKFLDELDKRVGVEIYREIVSSDTNTFQPQLLKGRARGITHYLAVLMPEHALQFGQQAKTLRIEPHLIGADIFADDQFLKEFIKLIPSTSFIYGEIAEWFVEAYNKEFQSKAFLLEAASGYVFAQTISRMYESNTKEKEGDIQTRLKQISLEGLAYKNAKFAEKSVRILSAARIVSAKEYLE
jgi:ABC-type branched-subunit amino acid transport system substrate-binding protein